jgi:hypothetical protein
LGDQLSFIVYNQSNELEENQSVEMFPVCSILNYQRQYTACKDENLEGVFQNELLGERKIPGIAEREAADLESLNFSIPSLNVSQEKAADDFIYAKDQKIHIVQGYVYGTKGFFLPLSSCSLRHYRA